MRHLWFAAVLGIVIGILAPTLWPVAEADSQKWSDMTVEERQAVIAARRAAQRAGVASQVPVPGVTSFHDVSRGITCYVVERLVESTPYGNVRMPAVAISCVRDLEACVQPPAAER